MKILEGYTFCLDQLMLRFDLGVKHFALCFHFAFTVIFGATLALFLFLLVEALHFPSILWCSLQQILLQSEEELMAKRSSELVSEGAAVKPKKIIGKMKVQGLLPSFLRYFFASCWMFHFYFWHSQHEKCQLFSIFLYYMFFSLSLSIGMVVSLVKELPSNLDILCCSSQSQNGSWHAFRLQLSITDDTNGETGIPEVSYVQLTINSLIWMGIS